MKSIVRVVVTLAAATLIAQTPIRITVQKQQSPEKQIAYAKGLIALVPATLGKPYERHIAVATAAANLQAVERAWPNDRPAIEEANALLANLYLNGEMPQNAVDAALHGLALSPHDHRLLAAAALAYRKLGNIGQAARFFEQADVDFDEQRGERLENITTLNQIAFYYETVKRYQDEARVLRRAAQLSGTTPIDRLVFLQRVLEAMLKANDRDSAKRDLESLQSAHRATLSMSRSPEQQHLIDQTQAAIQRYQLLLK